VTAVGLIATDVASASRIFEAITARLDQAGIAAALFEEPDLRATIELHFREPADEVAIRELVKTAAGAEAAAALTFERLPEVDWVRQGLAALTPVEAGRFTIHGAHDRRRVRANRIAIEIEAALAFGTGHHGTTRGCLIVLDRLLKRELARRRPIAVALPAATDQIRSTWHAIKLRRAAHRSGSSAAPILDIGTGTGILAIGAAKALRRPVLASDIDPRAVAVARGNARLNCAAQYVEVIRADGVARRRFHQRGPYWLIFANILLEPLQRMATPMKRLMGPKAAVVLSGLLAGQERAGLATYCARGLVLAYRLKLDGWVTLVLRRP
jgi:ribosomal protein L11 methyltransferase